ncbi:MAG: hypothetical protein LBS56_03010 [Propionibacteriaceae bacterium]|jgi:glycerol kinase|nr:hypothetical protein [Propionibacteriaceae bacterium]
MTRQAVLAVDEGTTGTRAALVEADGTVGPVAYEKLDTTSRPGGVVEQDAEQVLAKTLQAIRQAVDQAGRDQISVAALGFTSQRMTTILWDARSGRALAPAMVWQDTRHAAEVIGLGMTWNSYLLPRIGRIAGSQSPYVWAGHQLREVEAVREASQAGALRLGSIESWLLWHLTGGRTFATSATLAWAMGAYDLASGDYVEEWVEAVGVPLEALPPIVDDEGDFGLTDPSVVGLAIPIRSAIGDQQAAAIGLGAVQIGQVTCVHGTGSFVDLAAGDSVPRNSGLHIGAIPMVAWRRGGASAFAVEASASTTGAAVAWLCDVLGWFASPAELVGLARTVPSSGGVTFVPALVGVSLPRAEPQVRAALSGVGLTTTKAHVARAVVEGVAHSVVTCLEAAQQTAAIWPTQMIVGGGLSASDVLLQAQADFSGLPIARPPGANNASLLGAAFLAGLDTVWGSLPAAHSTIGEPVVFEPQIGPTQRGLLRAAWNSRIYAELEQAAPRQSLLQRAAAIPEAPADGAGDASAD